MKNPRRPIRYPGLVLDHVGLPDTAYNRRLLDQVDGIVVTDFTDGHCCMRAMRHPDVIELFEPGTTWLVAYLYDDHEEVMVRTFSSDEQQDDLPRAS